MAAVRRDANAFSRFAVELHEDADIILAALQKDPAALWRSFYSFSAKNHQKLSAELSQRWHEVPEGARMPLRSALGLGMPRTTINSCSTYHVSPQSPIVID